MEGEGRWKREEEEGQELKRRREGGRGIKRRNRIEREGGGVGGGVSVAYEARKCHRCSSATQP